MMSSVSRLLKANGSLPQHPESSFKALAPPPPTPNVMFARISVTTGSSAQCTSVLPVGRRHLAMWHIIVWRPSVISVIDGDILMMFAIRLPSQTFATLMEELTLTTTTSTPLWMTTRRMVHIEPGAPVYEGGNVTIFFLSHVFFLVSVVRWVLWPST